MKIAVLLPRASSSGPFTLPTPTLHRRRHPPRGPPPPTVSIQMFTFSLGDDLFPEPADKSRCPPCSCQSVLGEIRAVSMHPHVSLFHFAGMRQFEVESGVEWQPDGSHNKTVIERYVIVADSSPGFMLGNTVSGRHFC